MLAGLAASRGRAVRPVIWPDRHLRVRGTTRQVVPNLGISSKSVRAGRRRGGHPREDRRAARGQRRVLCPYRQRPCVWRNRPVSPVRPMRPLRPLRVRRPVVPASHGFTLASARVGSRLRVAAVDGARAEELAREGVLPGVVLEVASRTPLGGPVIVALGRVRLALSAEVAAAIRTEVLG